MVDINADRAHRHLTPDSRYALLSTTCLRLISSLTLNHSRPYACGLVALSLLLVLGPLFLD